MALAILIYMMTMTVVGIVIQIATVGKPKKVLTPAGAAAYTVFAMAHLVAYGYLVSQV